MDVDSGLRRESLFDQTDFGYVYNSAQHADPKRKCETRRTIWLLIKPEKIKDFLGKRIIRSAVSLMVGGNQNLELYEVNGRKHLFAVSIKTVFFYYRLQTGCR